MIYVLGSGPSGLIVANFLKNFGQDFKVITQDRNGFADSIGIFILS